MSGNYPSWGIRSVLLMVALASAAPAASASGDGPETECNNYGVINMVAVLGSNTYCRGGECTNEGVILFVGRTYSCHGNGLLVVCVGSTCQAVGENAIEAQGDPCGVATEPACWAERFACPTVREVRSGLFPEGPPQASSTGGPAVEAVHTSATVRDLVYGVTACECQPGDPRCGGGTWAQVLT